MQPVRVHMHKLRYIRDLLAYTHLCTHVRCRMCVYLCLSVHVQTVVHAHLFCTCACPYCMYSYRREVAIQQGHRQRHGSAAGVDGVSRTPSRQAGRQASKQTSKQTSKQASKQAANTLTSQPASKQQTRKQASKQQTRKQKQARWQPLSTVPDAAAYGNCCQQPPVCFSSLCMCTPLC
jgi:hypothetical protein